MEKRVIEVHRKFWKIVRAKPGLLAGVYVFCMLLHGVPSAAAQERTSDKIVPGELTALVPKSWPPHYSVDDNGHPAGFAIEVLNNVAERAGLRIKYKIMPNFPAVITAFEAGEGDLIPNVGITRARAKYISFGDPVETFVVSFFARRNSTDIRIERDLTDRRVGTVAKSVAVKLLKEREHIISVNQPSLYRAFFELLSGNIDAIAYPQPVFMKLARNLGLEDRIKIVGAPLAEIKRGIAVRKGNLELLARINRSVEALMTSPDYEDIYLKWFGTPEPFWTHTRIVIAFAIVFASLVIGFLILHYLRVIALNRELKDTINERQRAEDATRQTEVSLASAQRIAHLGNWATDLRNGTLWWSDETYRIFGLNPREDVASRELFRNSIHPEDRKIVDRAINLAFQKKKFYNIDHRIVLPGGGVKFVHDQAEVMFDDDGEPVSISGTIQDISERKRAEEELRKAHDDLELRVIRRTHALTEEIQARRAIEVELLDKTELQQMLYTVTAAANESDDPDEAMVACLKEVCDYTTWPVGHIYAVSPSDPEKFIPTDIWHMEDPEWFSVFHDITMNTVFKKGIGLIGRVMAGGKPEWIEDVTNDPGFIRAVPGMDITVKAAFCFPVKVRNEVVAVMEFFSPFVQKKDQSLMQSIEHIGTQLGRLYERTEVEDALLEAKNEADAANKAKSEFLSSMSHELRTPLNAIIGFSQMLQINPSDTLNEKQETYVEHITDSGHHLLKLINEVLDLAKIEAGKVELSFEEVDVGGICSRCLNLMETIAEERDIKVSINDSTDDALKVWADETRLSQVLLNLLSNAVKYNRTGGKVELSVTNAADGMVRFSVTDTGHGIPEDRIKELFEPFSRLDAETTNIEGTGIGLSVTSELVELMSGRMSVESTVGTGSTFWIELPQVMKPPLSGAEASNGAENGDQDSQVQKARSDPDGYSATRHERLRCIEDVAPFEEIERHTGDRGGRIGHGQRPGKGTEGRVPELPDEAV